MCGIAGLVSLSGKDLADDGAAVVSTMCDVQVHRGPDDRGVTALGRAVLGSNRLSIIDLSEAGHMPMSDPRTGRWITFNGEVYNFAELRNELQACGHQFRSHTDTEIVLHAYEEWGEAALNRFVGMFAFAIYDPRADTLILVRDRYGKKPFYYAQRNGQLLFASEIKALARVLGDVRPNYRRGVVVISKRRFRFDGNAVRRHIGAARGTSPGSQPRARAEAETLLRAGAARRSRDLRALRTYVAADDRQRDRGIGADRYTRSPGQRRARRHPVQRRHRLELDHGAGGGRPEGPAGIQRVGHGPRDRAREPLRKTGDRQTRHVC